ncbi:hypothetical protein [Acidithiobacillus ferriphilus]|jgi:hypothetical protein|nr:hypothetical protein [Acidithiobacillus ferriphilus]MEB8475674.1 hypothetical protein [Acidithiobacillus ferriphilus]
MIPLEITFAIHDFIKDRGLLDKTEFYYTYPIGRVHSLENVAKWAAPEFDRMGIQYETLFNMKEVDGKNAAVLSEEGGTVKLRSVGGSPAAQESGSYREERSR